MKCKHEHVMVIFRTRDKVIYWCEHCGAWKDNHDITWWLPKSAEKIERLEKKIKKLRAQLYPVKDWDAKGMEEYDKI